MNSGDILSCDGEEVVILLPLLDVDNIDDDGILVVNASQHGVKDAIRASNNDKDRRRDNEDNIFVFEVKE